MRELSKLLQQLGEAKADKTALTMQLASKADLAGLDPKADKSDIDAIRAFFDSK